MSVAMLSLVSGNPTRGEPKSGVVVLYPSPSSVGVVVVDWGDGSAPDAVTFDGQTPQVTVSHTYADRGVYVPILSAPSGNQTIQPPVVVR